MTREKLLFKNPVIAAQVLESPFVPDPHLGHTMPEGKEFIGENDYIANEELISEIKNNNKKIILNIGDSSTSGWDSNVVTQNRERKACDLPPIPAFFQYKTYSDYLRDLIGYEYTVINAGVPAHTSLQGSLRLAKLLSFFKKENICIDYVTAYYGNNDSVWDHNRQDKEWVGKKQNVLLNKLRKRFSKRAPSIITRVSDSDYKTNMKKIIDTCQEYNAEIIIIEPSTPLYWKPGCRVLSEDLERCSYPGSERVYKLLDEGLELWCRANKEKSYSDLKRLAFEEITEKDYVVPRIKRDHLANLRALIKDTQVPYVQVDLDRSEDDIRYFIDYCHPIDGANELIANELAAVISGKKSGKEHLHNVRTQPHRASNHNLSLTGAKLDIPTTHYTLY